MHGGRDGGKETGRSYHSGLHRARADLARAICIQDKAWQIHSRQTVDRDLLG